MKNKKKTLLMSLAAVLLVAAGVFGTLAYLTSTTETVENIFTVGTVDITLDEAEVDGNGKKIDDGKRVSVNNYKLIPGTSYDKDPTVHVSAESEDSWLFVKLNNTLKNFISDEEIENQMKNKGWEVVNASENIWRQTEKVTAGKDYVLFETFTVKDDVGKDAKPENLTVKAFAIQAENLTEEDANAEALKVLNQ